MALTRQQTLLLSTLAEHADGGGEAIGTHELDAEMNRRHNRHMGYDAMFGALKRLAKRGLVTRTLHHPSRWEITDAGREALRG